MALLTPSAFVTVAGCCRTVNNRDEVVGFSIDPNGMSAFRLEDGKMMDLNTLIPANSTLHLMGAFSINDDGDTAGQGCVLPACTELHAYRALSQVVIHLRGRLWIHSAVPAWFVKDRRLRS